jgi:esterase FrsA
MPYTYPIDPAAMFEDRVAQMLGFGIPQADVDVLRKSIRDMWLDAPGGWVYGWSAVAARYASAIADFAARC